mmetsp:Transcript_46535/g.88849  ORF Transcript_46535/g.88849 Transcript_46535/m.88849 type:complete len:414 (-) Transcript_46535:1259-2500(-)
MRSCRSLVRVTVLLALFNCAHAGPNSETGASFEKDLSTKGSRALLAAFWHPKNYQQKGGGQPAGSESAAFPGPGATGSSRSGGRRAADSGQSRESVHTQTEKHTQPGLAPAPFGRGITKEEVKADPCQVIFAAFFVSKPDGFKRDQGERCNGCHESPMHITFDSAKIVHPGGAACGAVLTDLETDLTNIQGLEGVQIHRFENVVNRSSIGTPNLMYERMKLYKAFVKRALDDGYDKHLVLLDTDIVVVGDILHVFKKEFDYGLSARGNDGTPVQGGLQLAHKDTLHRADKWLSLVLEVWESKAAAHKRHEYGFTGDQYIYAEVIGDNKAISKRAMGSTPTYMDVDKGEAGVFNIMFVPAERYNRQPGGPGMDIKKKPISILHYKGGRKDKMYVVYTPMKSGGLNAVYKLKGML